MDYVTIIATEMSTIRMKKGEQFIAIEINGPRGGGAGMTRIDIAEAVRLSKALTDAVRRLERKD